MSDAYLQKLRVFLRGVNRSGVSDQSQYDAGGPHLHAKPNGGGDGASADDDGGAADRGGAMSGVASLLADAMAEHLIVSALADDASGMFLRVRMLGTKGVAPGQLVRTLITRTSRSGIICTGMRRAAAMPSTQRMRVMTVTRVGRAMSFSNTTSVRPRLCDAHRLAHLQGLLLAVLTK